MRVLFYGTPDFAVPALRALVAAGYEVLEVVTQPDRPRGRSGEPLPPPVKTAAINLGLPVLQPESVKTEEFLAGVAALRPDIQAVVAFGRIFPPALLRATPLGSVNLHASLLPRWRGAAPIQWSLAAGDRVTGVTTMRMAEGCDTGPILLQETTGIGPEETAGELSGRLSRMGAALLVETLRGLEAGTLTGRPQTEEGVTRAPILRVEDGDADWSLAAGRLYDRWRGFQPWPGLHTRLEGRKLTFVRVRPMEPAGGAPRPPEEPGTLWSPGKGRLAVSCGEGTSLEVLEVLPQGRKVLRAADALNGRLLQPGQRFAPPPGRETASSGGKRGPENT